MAGDWMKIELELPDKPEVHAIANILNIESDLVVGKLFRVWQWFDKHTTDGNAHGVTFSLPDRITGVTGFGEAMQFVGWLEQHDKILHMPNFNRHTSASAKQRALTAKRVDKKRNANSNGDSVTVALPREEKRREDINTIVSNDVADCPHSEIIKLYEKHLPMLTQISKWTETRAKVLKSRWREDKKRQSLDWWDRFFLYVSKSGFLLGSNDKNWQADMDWILKEANFIKIIEGKYHAAIQEQNSKELVF